MRKIKIYFTILVLLVTTVKIQAQDNVSDLKIGVAAGVNFANQSLSGDGMTIKGSSIVLPSIGLNIQKNINSSLGIKSGLFYNGLGAKFSDGGTNTLNYLAIPALINYKLSETGLNFFSGIQYAFLLSAKSKYQNVTTDIKKDYKGGEFSGILGAEYQLSGGLNFAAQYQLGLSNIASDKSFGGTYKNNAFTIKLGYYFIK